MTCSFIPVCGKCRYCATGRQNLCDAYRNAETGLLASGQFRFHQDGEDFGGLCALGTFSQYAVVHIEYSVVKVPARIGFDGLGGAGCLRRADRLGFGGARGRRARLRQTVVIYGAGGVGSNAVQGARSSPGARRVVVVDPVAFKRDMALSTFGATHAFATAEEAFEFVREDTWGELADRAIITVGILHDKVIARTPSTSSARPARSRSPRSAAATSTPTPASCSATAARSRAPSTAAAVPSWTSYADRPVRGGQTSSWRN